MKQPNELNLQKFIYPHRPYHGVVKPEELVFNANLQEFAQRVGYICNLQTRGKISVQESYQQVNELWNQLKDSYKTLEIDPDTGNGIEIEE